MKENLKILYSCFREGKYYIFINKEAFDFFAKQPITEITDKAALDSLSESGWCVVTRIEDLPKGNSKRFFCSSAIITNNVFYVSNKFLFDLLKRCMQQNALSTITYNGITCITVDFSKILLIIKNGKLTVMY